MMFFGKKKEIKPEIYSEEICQSCGENSRREFKEGDYIYGSGTRCKKCSSNTLITAIYGEYPEEKH